jgi:hypothetical protein|tara:strand:- start:363 stop:1028 length:666 start_codon:yes stop_codon:yes gene_type:complete
MSNYFKQVPDFEYVSRLPDAKISDYVTVKNLFRKGKLRDDILQDLTLFTKYQIQGNDRPDNVAFDYYEDSNLDWLVLTCNNIINIQSEWPLLQVDFDRYLIEKYNSYENLNAVHHYETTEVKNSSNVVIVKAGLTCESDYSISFFDTDQGGYTTRADISVPITNYEYESKIEDAKRNIFLLKPKYLNIVKDDMDDIMPYKKGSTQYVSETLVKGENIKLYQ